MPGWGGHTAAMQWGPSNTTTWGGPTAGMYGGPLRCILRVDPSLQPEELPISEVKSKPFTDANPFDPLRSSDEEDDSSDGDSVADLTSDELLLCVAAFRADTKCECARLSPCGWGFASCSLF